eukprot:m.160543 g.160543  ORF g.160543 m.160543 type:complete len:137 (+) comp14557_c0_seq5:2044-2454(+)
MKACGTPGVCRSLTTRQLFSLDPMHSGSVENESCDLFLSSFESRDCDVSNFALFSIETNHPSIAGKQPSAQVSQSQKFSVVVDSRNNISNPSQRYYLEKHSMVTHSRAISFRRVPRSIFDSYSIPAFTVCEVLREN